MSLPFHYVYDLCCDVPCISLNNCCEPFFYTLLSLDILECYQTFIVSNSIVDMQLKDWLSILKQTKAVDFHALFENLRVNSDRFSSAIEYKADRSLPLSPLNIDCPFHLFIEK